MKFMKKVMVTTLMGALVAVGGMSGLIGESVAAPVYASGMSGMYENNLWDDSNYELVRGHMGYGNYIDWSSAVLISDRGIGPGQTRFAVNIVTYSVEKNTIVGTHTYEYIESREGTFCSVDGNGYQRFNENEEYGYNQIVIETYKRCMRELRR